MNEQIKEFMKQAGTDTSGKWMSIDNAEKFAELIVKECMAIADEQKKYVEDMEVFNEQDATWNKARIQQSQQIVDKIKQHFGVEE
jgi:hypothetical protein